MLLHHPHETAIGLQPAPLELSPSSHRENLSAQPCLRRAGLVGVVPQPKKGFLEQMGFVKHGAGTEDVV